MQIWKKKTHKSITKRALLFMLQMKFKCTALGCASEDKMSWKIGRLNGVESILYSLFLCVNLFLSGMLFFTSFCQCNVPE